MEPSFAGPIEPYGSPSARHPWVQQLGTLLWVLAWVGRILHRGQAGLGLSPLCPLCPRMDAISLGHHRRGAEPRGSGEGAAPEAGQRGRQAGDAAP